MSVTSARRAVASAAARPETTASCCATLVVEARAGERRQVARPRRRWPTDPTPVEEHRGEDRVGRPPVGHDGEGVAIAGTRARPRRPSAASNAATGRAEVGQVGVVVDAERRQPRRPAGRPRARGRPRRWRAPRPARHRTTPLNWPAAGGSARRPRRPRTATRAMIPPSQPARSAVRPSAPASVSTLAGSMPTIASGGAGPRDGRGARSACHHPFSS